MNKIMLISIMVLASVFAVPMVLAVDNINITKPTAQAGPPGSASINGTFFINNNVVSGDGMYNVAVTGLTLQSTGPASIISGTDTFLPSGFITIDPESNVFYTYNVGVQGIGKTQIQVMVWGNYVDNHSYGQDTSDGYFGASSALSNFVDVTSDLPEFSLSILPLLLSMLLFGIIRRKLK